MDSVFGLARKNPRDDQVLLAASAIAEQNSSWPQLLEALQSAHVKADLGSRMFLTTLARCLENSNPNDWSLDYLEEVLVSLLPRWGALVNRDSLASLFRVIKSVCVGGIETLNSTTLHASPGFPKQVLDQVSQLRSRALSLIWYGSALSVLMTSLKCAPGDTESSVVNLLVQYHWDNEKSRQSVIEAQELALECLAVLYAAVSGSDHDSSLDQLGSILKQSGSDAVDSASLPLIVSVASILVGGAKVKPRAETVDAAALCLGGILSVCDSSQSLFLITSKVKSLWDEILIACIAGVKERSSAPCARLIETLVKTSPTTCMGSKDLVSAIQENQIFFESSRILLDCSPPAAVAADAATALTSGRAVALVRESDQTKLREALDKFLGDPEWIKQNLFLSDSDVKRLTNYYALLQAHRISPSWILDQRGLVSKPSLDYILWNVASSSGTTSPPLSPNVEGVNEALVSIRTKDSLFQSIAMMMYALETPVSERVKIALFAAAAALDIDAVREAPVLAERLARLIEIAVQKQVTHDGLDIVSSSVLKSSPDSGGSYIGIMCNLAIIAVPFSGSAAYSSAIDQVLKCLPLVTVGARDQDEYDVESQLSVISVIEQYIAPARAITTTPSVLGALEALIESVGSTIDDGGAQRILEYIVNIIAEFTSTASGDHISASTTIQLLSCCSSVLITFSADSSVSAAITTPIWMFLCTHPFVRSASTATAWDNRKLRYSSMHLVWVHSLCLATILLEIGAKDGSARFFATYGDALRDRFSTAHTSDLATLEEACLISRLFELGQGQKPLWPFQFTSLITPKAPSMYPKSRSEKLAGNLPRASLMDDVQTPCEVPCVYAQRVVWVAVDTLTNSMRRIIQNPNLEEDTQALFHALLDCSHFVLQYLGELTAHKSRVVELIGLDQVDTSAKFVPLSVYISHGNRRSESAAGADKQTTLNAGRSGSLLNLMSSPPTKASQPSSGDAPGKASLMDSLTPRNSPSPKSVEVASAGNETEKPRFVPALLGDCLMRAGMSFITPSVVSEDEFVKKLVDLLTLCLVQAMQMATTEAFIRPLLDLLMTTKSAKTRLPSEAVAAIGDIIDLITPRYNEMTSNQRARQQTMSVPPSISQATSLPSLGYSPLGYATIDNIR